VRRVIYSPTLARYRLVSNKSLPADALRRPDGPERPERVPDATLLEETELLDLAPRHHAGRREERADETPDLMRDVTPGIEKGPDLEPRVPARYQSIDASFSRISCCARVNGAHCRIAVSRATSIHRAGRLSKFGRIRLMSTSQAIGPLFFFGVR